jgi:alpha-D-xyloside xylohydrolase
MNHPFYLLICSLFLLSCSQEPKKYTKTERGIVYQTQSDSIVISVISGNIFRVEHYNRPYKKMIDQVPLVLPVSDVVDWKVTESESGVQLSTDQMTLSVGDSYQISFRNKNGEPLTSALQPEEKNLKQTFTCADEAIYGMGQFQNGLMNLKNAPLRLKQYNQEIANPFMVSTKGYGILWNNTSITDFNFPENKLNFNQLIDSVKNIRKTVFVPAQSGIYHFAVESLNPKGNRFAGPVLLTFNGDTVIHYNTTWVPDFHSGEVYLEKDKSYEVVFTNTNSQIPGEVFYNLPDFGKSVFQSPYGNGIDYYFVSGAPAEVIAGYRKLTGTAPLFGKWAYGFWQCRERYHSQQELLENAQEYRKRNIPIDNIVQDWNYWPDKTWGPEWNRKLYPDPKKMCSELKEMNMNLMVSVWPRMDNPKLEERYNLTKFKINKSGNLDLFNPEVRESYYRMLKDSMFAIGVSSIWLDGTEPEEYPLGFLTSKGLFDHNALAYSLMVTQAAFEGHRKDYPDKRVFNLTRSAFAGQQRYGAAVWSGDVLASWEQLSEQITAGLNISMSGLPYWTTDIGGFFRDSKSLNPQFDDQYTNDAFKELLTRWFQFGTFCPLFRIHGYVSNTEIWRYGKPFEEMARNFIDLRYQLMPYIYSTANEVTTRGAAVIKPLVHDYPNDPKCWNIKDQFLFGNSLMICPVTEKGERKREVYLPEGTWVDFWTGKSLQGNTILNVDAPLERIPLYVKAGAVIPVGPKVQFAMQKTAWPLRILVYPGANGNFELYEDEGENYNYENGQSSKIVFNWNDATKTLKIGNLEGSFDGMQADREFMILLVKDGVGGLENGESKRVSYKGSTVQVKL